MATRCCNSLRKQHFFVLQKRHFERRIISKHEDIHWSQRSPCQTTGPNHAGFLPFSYLDDKVWKYFEEKVGRLAFTFAQIRTSHSHNFHNLQPIFNCNIPKVKLTLRWPGGGGGCHPPTGFSKFSQKWEELFVQTKFLPVGSSLGHLSMKNFSDQTCSLGSKIRQREGAGGRWQPPPPPTEQKLTYFSNHEDDIQS